MSARPYVVLSCAMSLDGYLDSTRPQRLTMSNATDLDRVDGVRAGSDAILVGASTIRRDDPRLLVRSAERRMRRAAAGLSDSPAKVTVTSSGDLSPDAAFFVVGDAERIVYCPPTRVRRLATRLSDRATVVGLGERIAMADVLDDLGRRGTGRLMVEGGGAVLTQFLAAGLADELQLVIAPFFVGEARAPRFVQPAGFPWTAGRRATLAETRAVGDVVLLRYALSERFGEPDALARRRADGAEAEPLPRTPVPPAPTPAASVPTVSAPTASGPTASRPTASRTTDSGPTASVPTASAPNASVPGTRVPRADGRG
jgi:5-amino-6-(5-phosphoribosylamino)uracil reductase